MNSSTRYDKIGQTFVSIFLLVFPLFVWPFRVSFTNDPFDISVASKSPYVELTANKMMFFVIALVAFAIMLLFKYAFASDAPDERPKRSFAQWRKDNGFPWLYLPDLFLLLFFVGGVITWCVAPYGDLLNRDSQSAMWLGGGRFDGLAFYFAYALLYVLVAHFGQLRTDHVKYFSVVVLVMNLFAVLQLAGINVLQLYPPSTHNGTYHDFLSTIGNVDIMGGFLCLAAPLIGVGYVVFRLNMIYRSVFLVSHTLAVYVMFSMNVDVSVLTLIVLIAIIAPMLIRNQTYVKKMLELSWTIVGGWLLSSVIDYQYDPQALKTITYVRFDKTALVLLVVSVVLIGLWFLIPKKFSWKWLRRGFVIGECWLLVMGFCYFRFVYQPADPPMPGLMNDLYELVRLNLSDTAGTHRIGIWRHALGMSQENPVFGTGCGTFAETFREYAAKVGYERYADGSRILDFAHNEYVHHLCTLGLWGLLSYLGFLCSSFVFTLKYYCKNPRILVLGAAVLGYSIQVFFSFGVIIVAPLFWLLMGLLMKEIRLTHAELIQKESAAQVPPSPETPC
ncbi:MAG: O-antigen ligase family protein [Clostridia bacterium]|nr:O-antigen ligase family protein [Clostridia bacterium]